MTTTSAVREESGIGCTVVMTASIRPHPSAAASGARVDPALRTADYARALQFWLNLSDPRIRQVILIENTGSPLDALQRAADDAGTYSRNVEFVSLNDNVIPDGVSYGYAEYRLIDEGLARSRTYSYAPYMIKATGRYTFPNISRLLDRLPFPLEVAVDARDRKLFSSWRRQFVTAALFVARREYFDRELRGVYRQMRPPPHHRKQFIEDVLFDHLIGRRHEPGVMLRWPVNCDPVGFGLNGDSYTTPRKRLVYAVRALTRRILPNWWF